MDNDLFTNIKKILERLERDTSIGQYYPKNRQNQRIFPIILKLMRNPGPGIKLARNEEY